MELARLKTLLKKNSAAIKGKELRVNEVVYPTLKSFGTAILDLSKNDNLNWTIDVCVGDYPLNFENTENSIRNTLTRNFNTIKVFGEKIAPYKFTMPTERAIEEFGTNA
jgi:hypothetical protein